MTVTTKDGKTTFEISGKKLHFNEWTAEKIQEAQVIEAELQGLVDGGDLRGAGRKLKEIYKG